MRTVNALKRAARPRVAIDLFSGCGGLSLGVRRAGFNVAAAIELDDVAAATYESNHPETHVLVRDIRSVTASQLLAKVQGRPVDLVMGCAPCQGFCSLTAKHHREDPRNRLVLEMARLVEQIRPRAVLMENVPGVLTRGANLFEEFLAHLQDAGYVAEARIVQMADYGVPQQRRRLVLLAGRGFKIPIPKATHARAPKPGSGLKPWVTVREALAGIPAAPSLTSAWRRGGPRSFNWHVVRDLQQRTKARLKAAKPGETWLSIDESLRPRCHQDGYTGFTNVYGRMAWDQAAPTITAGCTTPCKGRFGHPDRRRMTISVREAATLQTFPKSYRFETDEMDRACEMIGNAVPPRFAAALGRAIGQALSDEHVDMAW